MPRKADARTFGQDLMRGEHVVGGAQHSKQTASSDGLAIGITTGAYQHAGEDAPPSATGTSIFDPVLCEIAYRWFCPPGGLVLDPFAGGSVRGIVAAKLGRRYLGVDLRPEQIEANRAQWAEIEARATVSVPSRATISDPATMTPVDRVGDIWVKREDLFKIADVAGGKVRTCYAIALAAKESGAHGIVTAGSRASPQCNIVAHVGRELGLKVRAHTPTGALPPELQSA